jgi:hypothetical protein
MNRTDREGSRYCETGLLIVVVMGLGVLLYWD